MLRFSMPKLRGQAADRGVGVLGVVSACDRDRSRGFIAGKRFPDRRTAEHPTEPRLRSGPEQRAECPDAGSEPKPGARASSLGSRRRPLSSPTCVTEFYGFFPNLGLITMSEVSYYRASLGTGPLTGRMALVVVNCALSLGHCRPNVRYRHACKETQMT